MEALASMRGCIYSCFAILVLLTLASCERIAESESKHGVTASGLFPLPPDEKTLALKLTRTIPDGSDAGLFLAPVDLAVTREGGILVLDQRLCRVTELDPWSGEQLASWGGKGWTSGGFIMPQVLLLGPDGRIYVGDGKKINFQIFDRRGRYIEEFKDYDGIIFASIRPTGELYCSPMKSPAGPAEVQYRVYNKLGRLIREVREPEISDFQELKYGEFLAPVFIGNKVILLSKHFPVFRVFDSGGVLEAEVLINDSRFDAPAAELRKQIQVRGGIAGGRRYLFQRVEAFGGNLVILLNRKPPGVEFLVVNPSGQVVSCLLYNPDNEHQQTWLVDFIVMTGENDKPLFVGLAGRPRPGIVLLSP